MGRWEIFIKYPHWTLFVIAGVFLWGAVFNANSSERAESYRETEAEICNVEEVQVLWHKRFVTRYNYDVVWYADGVEYIRHRQEEIDRISEGKRNIWVSKDNQKFVLYSPEEIEKESNRELLIAAVAGIAGVVALMIQEGKRSKRRKTERRYGKS